MTGSDRVPNLGEAASVFMAGLSQEERGASQKEISDFIRWFGRSREITGLTPAEIGNYADRLSLSDTDYTRKLALIRGFLQYAKKQGWSKTNLATHLKARKARSGKQSATQKKAPESIQMTQEGYDGLVSELADLKDARDEVTVEIRKAAADKDFRENAPLHAARERKGQIEGRIMELEATLKAAVVINEAEKKGTKISLGNTVVLHDIDSGAEIRYMLVSSNEVDPLKGKISGVSPIGRAIINKEQGVTVEISTPAGKLHYQIISVEN